MERRVTHVCVGVPDKVGMLGGRYQLAVVGVVARATHNLGAFSASVARAPSQWYCCGLRSEIEHL